ncbi:MAG: alpha-glucan family phosphorylase [Planctomycetota bacterium]
MAAPCALGIHPGVLHLNEGHSAFAVLEAVAERMEETGQAFHEALPYVAEKVVFTTHTPVPAGHDRFPPDLALHFLRPLQQRLQLSDHELLGLGRVDPHDPNEEFCMTVLALRTSTRANAVSALHGFVSRRMWNCLWPEREVSEVPLGHVTNGVHLDTWLARELRPIYQETLGNDWEKRLCEPECWAGFEEVDRHLLWTTKLALKMKLFRNIEHRHRTRNERLGLDDPAPVLDPEVLTIGFARRFATYKRATLLFEDLDRALRLISDPQRPVQLVVAGKAHPADEPGQALLRRLFELARDDRLRNRLVVVENYDKALTRHMLAGVDLWLNVPRRPMEACGTSGMKALYNATLNCSTLDGWWNEAYDTRNGFGVGKGLLHVDHTIQDRRDATALLEVLEQEVVPSYYDGREEGIPRDWLDRVVRAMVSLGPLYHSERMVRDYVEGMYLHASKTLTSRFVSGS